MQKQKISIKQHDLFLHDAEKMPWENIEQKRQKKTIILLAQLLLTLSSQLVNHGGSTCNQK